MFDSVILTFIYTFVFLISPLIGDILVIIWFYYA